MKKGILFLVLVFVLPVWADEETSNWIEKQMPFKSQNVMVPQEVWTKITELLTPQIPSGKKIDDYTLIPVTLTVELSSTDPYVLKDQKNYRLTFAEGGGTLDFFDYVLGKGEFFIRISPQLMNDTPFHFLYVSDSPEKRVGDETWGNGCGKIYNLTDATHRFLYDPGMRVTSARRQYLSLLSGIFIFVQLVEERIFLGYIQATDTRYPQFNCRNQ